MKRAPGMAVAVAVACGLLTALPSAANAARPGPSGGQRHPGPPVPKYEQQPRFWETSGTWRLSPEPNGKGAERPRAQGPKKPQQGKQREGGDARAGEAAAAVVRAVNRERDRAGCPQVHPHRDLMRAARGHSAAMGRSGRLSHYETDGSDVSDRMTDAGYAYSKAAENVSAGPPDGEAAVESWMESPGHRRNIVNCAFQDVGVGVSFAPDGPWWTLLLAAPR